MTYEEIDHFLAIYGEVGSTGELRRLLEEYRAEDAALQDAIKEFEEAGFFGRMSKEKKKNQQRQKKREAKQRLLNQLMVHFSLILRELRDTLPEWEDNYPDEAQRVKVLRPPEEKDGHADVVLAFCEEVLYVYKRLIGAGVVEKKS